MPTLSTPTVSPPTLSLFLWLCTAAYAIHVLEEFVFNWQSWARHVLHLPAR